MPIADDELRAMVRESIARHLLRDRPAAPSTTPALPAAGRHVSHGRFLLGPGGDADGRCIVEPAVECTHCGYCQSLGH